jgi:hypothetical protein
MRENELMYSCAETAKLKELGWSCNYNLEQGAKTVIEYKTVKTKAVKL